MHSRITCSSISLRHRPLAEALSLIHAQGFRAIDLGALPGVCDHVPHVLDAVGVSAVAGTVAEHDLTVVSINADIGDMNRHLDGQALADREQHLDRLIELCRGVGTTALVLPNGSQGRSPLEQLDGDLDRSAEALLRAGEQVRAAGLQLWVEAQHSGRLCFNLERAAALMQRLDGGGIGVVLDFSHVIAAGDDLLEAIGTMGQRIAHVHLRDAVPGDIHLSIGRGEVDFAAGIAALEAAGYTGCYSLELETADVSEQERPAAAGTAGQHISQLLDDTHNVAQTS